MSDNQNLPPLPADVRVGQLPTMNQDEYPGLGDWWIQLRFGKTGDGILARVYGDSPKQVKDRAEAICAALQHAQQADGEAVAEIHSGTLRWLVGDDHPVRECGHAYLFTRPAASGEAVAWMTDDGRVISAQQKAVALRDGGASASSVAPFCIALVRPAPSSTEQPAGTWLPTDADMGDGFRAGKRVHVIPAHSLPGWWVGHGKSEDCQIEGSANHWFWLAYLMLGLVEQSDVPYTDEKPLPFSPAYVRARVLGPADLSTHSANQQGGVPEGLIEALGHQRQIDEDGTEVGVSRQAVDEAIAILAALTATPSTAEAEPIVPDGYYGPIRTPLDAIYEQMAAMDNQDVPLEEWPGKIINALTRVGYAVVLAELPHKVLGEAAIAGIFETGNPKHGWDYLIARCRFIPVLPAAAQEGKPS